MDEFCGVYKLCLSKSVTENPKTCHRGKGAGLSPGTDRTASRRAATQKGPAFSSQAPRAGRGSCPTAMCGRPRASGLLFPPWARVYSGLRCQQEGEREPCLQDLRPCPHRPSQTSPGIGGETGLEGDPGRGPWEGRMGTGILGPPGGHLKLDIPVYGNHSKNYRFGTLFLTEWNVRTIMVCVEGTMGGLPPLLGRVS